MKYTNFEANKQQLLQLKRLVDKKVSETEIDNFLTNNPEIFAFALHGFRTGHHGIVVIPKQQIKIKNKIDKDDYGLIPDFLIAGENSDGYQWWVVELKGVCHEVFNKDRTNRISFSDTANKGIIQLLEYIDFCDKYQATLRDAFNLQSFSRPSGLFIIGHEDEFKDLRKMAIKSAWNKINQSKLEIRTFSWLLREFFLQDKAHNFRLAKDSPEW